MNKVKKTLFISVALILAVSCVLAGCSTSGPAPTKENPLVLRWVAAGPAAGVFWELMETYSKKIEDRTEGRVDVELYPAGALCEPLEIPAALKTGVADIGFVHPSFIAGELPKTELLMIPFVFPVGEARIKMNEELMPKYLAPEWESVGIKMMLPYTGGNSRQAFSKIPIRSMEEFKGVKIAATSGIAAKALELVGFSPVNMPGQETYLALEKGVIDAATQWFWSADQSKYQEVCSYVTMIDLTADEYFGWAMNPDTLKDLPSDIKKIVEEEIYAAGESYETDQVKWDEEAKQRFLDAGIEIITLTPQEHEIMKQSAQPLVEEWIATQEKAGMKDAREYAEYCLKLRDKYEGK
ncbi:MAG: TRAP transporter substrate-binding protein DctP [Dehalococcoidia bacterium]